MITLRRLLPTLLMALPGPALAQGVLVAPHAVFIDHATRAGAITLYNPGSEAVEVGVSFAFGYPQTDSAGSVSIEIADSAPAGAPSAMAWLQAFPRRVTVPPQTRQTVRLLASPPPGLADGEYWARLIVSAKGGKIPVAGAADTSGVQIGLDLEVRTVLSVMYRKGPLTTGLVLGAPSAAYAGDSIALRVPMRRTGTAAYLGTARTTVLNARNEVVGRDEMQVAVYYEMDPRLVVHVGPLPAGTYKARVEVTTTRADLPPRAPLTAPTVRDSIMVSIP